MKVLLGIGGTEDSVRALEQTVRRARRAGDDLTVAVVENPGSDRTPAEVERLVRDLLAETEVAADVRVLEGHPGSRLVELAESEGYDQISLGGGERSPMGKINLGRVAEFVLLNSQVTVKLVR